MRFAGILNLAVALCLCGLGSLSRAEIAAKTEKKAPPSEASEAIRKLLGDTCYQVMDGDKALFEFWFAASLPLKEKPASPDKDLDSLNTASLLGVVRISKELRDYRDDDLSKGVHTMRFGKIPADGNHLGATEYPYFAVLIPAAEDKEPATIKTFKQLTRASAKKTASEHPMIMSLRPVKEKPAAIPALTKPASEHQAIVVSAPAKTEAGDEAELIFEVVIEGHGKL